MLRWVAGLKSHYGRISQEHQARNVNTELMDLFMEHLSATWQSQMVFLNGSFHEFWICSTLWYSIYHKSNGGLGSFISRSFSNALGLVKLKQNLLYLPAPVWNYSHFKAQMNPSAYACQISNQVVGVLFYFHCLISQEIAELTLWTTAAVSPPLLLVSCWTDTLLSERQSKTRRDLDNLVYLNVDSMRRWVVLSLVKPVLSLFFRVIWTWFSEGRTWRLKFSCTI